LNTQQATLGAVIALLKVKSLGINPVTLIAEGLRTARKLNLEDAISGEISFEDAVCELKIITASTTYQDLAKWTVTKQKTGILSKVEMACDDYTHGRFRLVINDKVKWEDKQLPECLTLTFPDLEMGAERIVQLQGKSSDSTTFSMWGDITGKEIV